MNPIEPGLKALIDRVESAKATGTKLCIRGGGSKDFYGETPLGEPVETTVLAGITSYQPTELVVTARCGTRLAELEAVLAEKGQCLAFEPPHFGDAGKGLARRGATVGGMVAAGLSGPSRAAAGAVRDHVLGATVLNGKGEVLTFGGQVMKNVAGYDVSRLLAGSMGTLGLILEVSLKVVPIAPETVTLWFERDPAAALKDLNTWAGQPLPLHASAVWDGKLAVRLQGAAAAVRDARSRLGGDLIPPERAKQFWEGMRDHHDEFFVEKCGPAADAKALWRLSVPSTAPRLAVSGTQLIEWGGAQRWVWTTSPAPAVRDAAAKVGGHATLFVARDKSPGVFTALQPPLDRIHRNLKGSFDPVGVFNPGRLYPGL
jgi:glycolate oxidase FAD binding subunit